MGLLLWLSSSVFLLLNFSLFQSHALSCRDDERLALLQFKQSFFIDKLASSYEGAYSKVLSWKAQGGSRNCCSWDGVECDEKTGHVIGLILNSSCLHGSINSNSSLFHLVHLQKLNLADNHFNYSLIPSAIGQFSRLTYLNLSGSWFYGQIPSEISRLSKLTFLDLSSVFDSHDPLTQYQLLELKSPNLRSLVRNLTSLEWLSLTSVHIPSTVPDFLANFTSLKAIILFNCGLYGEFPVNIFHLQNLRVLVVGSNENLTGSLPEFHQRSPLEALVLSVTSFSGSIPSSIDKLESLEELSLQSCNFVSPLPSSLGKLTQLIELDLGKNHLGGPIPSWLGNLTQLAFLSLDENNLSGGIPSSFQKLTKLTILALQHNDIIGPIPTWIGNLSQLFTLGLGDNNLHGSIPYSLTKLVNMQFLFLQHNNLNGTVKFDMFFNMSLVHLDLGSNKFSLLFNQRGINRTTSKFMGIGLASCNLREFPYFLKYQNKLQYLDLSHNKIRGQIPRWMWNTSVETLKVFGLLNNSLVGFRPPSGIFLPWINLWNLDIRSNMLQGQLPIPPKSIRYYFASNNGLTGEIDSAICSFNFIRIIDLSVNNFTGMVPQCLANLSFLSVLNARDNSFHGVIPQLCTSVTNLEMLDLSHNTFEGQIPRSLSSCLMLEYLDLGNNKLIDVFPSWLGSLPALKLLSLRHNQFNGVIRKPKQHLAFPKLRVIDISNNNFTGAWPSQFIRIWNSMKAINISDSGYMTSDETILYVEGTQSIVAFVYRYSITIVDKGVKRYHEVIQENFAYIDFSCNKFTGEIPQFIGDLKALRSLNLSFNNLMGGIPSSLENLKALESLDLSHNKLSGEIPSELAQLTFLQSFDVSYNNLTGPIPQARQFGTFENTSYEGNPGLCGIPLSKKCEDSKALPLPPSIVKEDDNSETSIELDWKFVLSGCISGFFVGVALGDMVITKRRVWFLKAFRRVPRRMEIRQYRN